MVSEVDSLFLVGQPGLLRKWLQNGITVMSIASINMVNVLKSITHNAAYCSRPLLK